MSTRSDLTLGTARYARRLQSRLQLHHSESEYPKRGEVLDLIREGASALRKEPTLQAVGLPSEARCSVVGDLHGQFWDLITVLELCDEPAPNNLIVFNGDFVDRGSWGLEVFLLLLAWKVAAPRCVFLTRGNHESEQMTSFYGFAAEVRHKFDDVVYRACLDCFCALPLSVVLDRQVLILHGGLFSREGVTLRDILSVDRDREPPHTRGDLMMEALWSDPASGAGIGASPRGGSTIVFGPDITKDFLDRNQLRLVVRSHEVRDEGYSVEHGGRLVTVFSAPNYCDSYGNRGAVLRFEGGSDLSRPRFLAFDAAPHPNLPPMAYSRRTTARL